MSAANRCSIFISIFILAIGRRRRRIRWIRCTFRGSRYKSSIRRNRMRYWLVVIIASCLLGCDKPDARLATPKGAAKTLYQAMYDNDLATAKACVVSGPGQIEIAEGMTSFMAAARRATDAA